MSSKSIYNFLGPKRFYHFIFWAIAVISHMVDHIGVIDKAGVLPYLGLVLERNGLLMAIVYFNFYILIPKLYPVNRIIYSLLLIACMMIFAVVHGHYRVWLFNTYNIGNYENWGELSYNLLANFLNAGRFVLISVLLKFTVDWFDQQKELTQTKVDKLQVELKYLKNQINPHFLFNTLNSMYALSLKKSDKTPDMILRLSEMMEYMLYDSNEKEVRLVKDIEHLDNYIQLELIRTNDVKFNFSKHGEIKEQLIAPLLLAN
jgi:sensor histidine kinase YesM